MADKLIYSYEMNGVKQSFADWISNLSPAETPFTSSLTKEQVNNTTFFWQTDALAKAGTNAQIEGDDAVATSATPTERHSNYTQIFRKVVKVSATAGAVDSWGRSAEMPYQMGKKGKEILRDVEYAFLNNTTGRQENLAATVAADKPRLTAGFPGLVAALNAADPDTGAVVHVSAQLTEDNLFALTNALYRAGAEPSVIMFNPTHASTLCGFIETTGQGSHRVRMFDGVATKLNTYVQTFIDPLGQEFTLVPNRRMPENKIYIYNPKDFTQMVLRAPSRVALGKTGDSVKEMLVTECGLRLRNPYAAGILEVLPASPAATITAKTAPTNFYVGAADIDLTTLFSVVPSTVSLSFKGDKDTVATVSGNLLHAVGAGTVNVTASAPNAKDVVLAITVKAASTAFTLDKTTASVPAAGGTPVVVKLTGTPAGSVLGKITATVATGKKLKAVVDDAAKTVTISADTGAVATTDNGDVTIAVAGIIATQKVTVTVA